MKRRDLERYIAVPSTTPGTMMGISRRLASGPRTLKLYRARQSAAGTPNSKPTVIASAATWKLTEKPLTNLRWSRMAANQRRL